MVDNESLLCCVVGSALSELMLIAGGSGLIVAGGLSFRDMAIAFLISSSSSESEISIGEAIL